MIGKLTAPWAGAAPLLLRVAAGSVFLYHGLDRLGIVGPNGVRESIKEAIGEAEHAGFHPSELWGWILAITLAIAGLALLLGLFTRYFALLMTVIMGIAMFKLRWSAGFRLPLGWEYVYTLLCVCLALVMTGGGALSADVLLWPPDRKKKP